MPAYKIVVTDNRFNNYIEENAVFKELGVKVEIYDLAGSKDAKKVLKDADAVLVNLFPMTEEIIETMDKCKVISRYGVGYDNVDVEAATAKGIWVARVPDYSLEDVSDHTLALLLGSVRRIAYKDRMIREGKWNLHKDWPSYRIAGKTLGIIGFGAIGRTLFRKVSGFGFARVLVYDPYIHPGEIIKAGGTPASLEGLIKNADYISIHASLTEETIGMIGEKEFQQMKSSCILINTSRGPLVNGEDLYTALKEGDIAAAGIDVFETEPLPAGSPLLSLDNIILTDHTAWYSEESIVELKTKAARNILAVLKGEAPVYPVNTLP